MGFPFAWGFQLYGGFICMGVPFVWGFHLFTFFIYLDFLNLVKYANDAYFLMKRLSFNHIPIFCWNTELAYITIYSPLCPFSSVTSSLFLLHCRRFSIKIQNVQDERTFHKKKPVHIILWETTSHDTNQEASALCWKILRVNFHILVFRFATCFFRQRVNFQACNY